MSLAARFDVLRADAALAWEEIRGIVKGASLDPTRALLPREEYEALGRKRAGIRRGARPAPSGGAPLAGPSGSRTPLG